MIVEFSEYNVHPTDRNEYTLMVKPDVVYLNGDPCRDVNKVSRIVELCYENFDTAIQLMKNENHSYKGGCQCELYMQIRGVNVKLCGYGTDENVRRFYDNFKAQIEGILNEEI